MKILKLIIKMPASIFSWVMNTPTKSLEERYVRLWAVLIALFDVYSIITVISILLKSYVLP